MPTDVAMAEIDGNWEFVGTEGNGERIKLAVASGFNVGELIVVVGHCTFCFVRCL
jgi:hypothetical protein